MENPTKAFDGATAAAGPLDGVTQLSEDWRLARAAHADLLLMGMPRVNVLLIGAEFFGMWGMFLAAPVAAVVKALFHYFIIRPRTGKTLLPPAQIPQKEVQVGRPSIAGVGDHSRAH